MTKTTPKRVLKVKRRSSDSQNAPGVHKERAASLPAVLAARSTSKPATRGSSEKASRSRDGKRRAQTPIRRDRDWRVELARKAYAVEAWDWKENPRPRIRSLFRGFGLRPSLASLDEEQPERLLEQLAGKYKMFVYDLVSIRGSDMYGFILSKQKLSRREIQQVEADYWGEDYDYVYR